MTRWTNKAALLLTAMMLAGAAGAGVPANGGPYNARFLSGGIGIERPVGKKLATRQSLDQRPCAAQIMGLSRQQPKVGQVADRIGQSHDLGCYPSSRAPDGLALSPPFAPCPWR